MTNLIFSPTRNWNHLSDLKLELERIFDHTWPDPDYAYKKNQGLHSAKWSPTCEIEEALDHYLISLELAGISRDQIKVEFHDNQIVVSGERHEDRPSENRRSYSERYSGKFERTFALPVNVDASRVEANFQDGMLRLYVPKADSAKPRQIKITNGSEKGFFGKLIGNSMKSESKTTLSPSDATSEKNA